MTPTPTSTSCKKIHCTAVTNSPLKWYLRAKLNSLCHFLTVLNCFRHFYFTKNFLVKQEKDLIQKVLIAKTFLFEISRRLQNKVFVSANNLFISTPTVHLNHQFICKTKQKQEQWLWGALNISLRPPRGCFWIL